MRILIFENVFESVVGSFDILNLKEYSGELEYVVYPRSQNLERIDEILLFDLIIIDLDLSVKSEFDGFGIIRNLESSTLDVIPPILILTGQKVPENYVEEEGLSRTYNILKKPINYKKLGKAINNTLGN